MILLAGLVLLGLSASAQWWWGPQSSVTNDTIHSEVLGADREYTVYLPKSYATDTTRTYPVLYLLHGMTDTNRHWYERGHVRDVADQLMDAGEACEMVIVTPNAGGPVQEGNWNGYFNMEGWNYEDFFFNEFMPYIESTYRITPGRENRAIAGLSMGGGGCTSYAQRHPELFCAAYAMSALMNIPGNGPDSAPGMDNKVAQLNKAVREHNCIAYVAEADDARKQQLRSLAWFVDCGDDDFLLDRNIEFFQAMRQAGVPVQFRVRNGGHTWEYWHSALYNCLPFITRTMAAQSK